MPVPVSTFRGFLKRVSKEWLDPVATCVLDTAFPGFWPGDPDSEEVHKRTRALEEFGVDHIALDVATPRRFAGCWSLPRGRYSSLCYDDSGDDDGTLVNELNTYLDPLRAGLILFADLGVPKQLEDFRSTCDETAEPGENITIILIGRPGAINPVIERLADQGLIPEQANSQRNERCLVGARIPYHVEDSEIPNTFDLRRPECQEHVVEQFFKKDSKQLTKENRSGIDSFLDCLPVLMDPAVGGGPAAEGNGAILQALASFLREQGAEALVYPSARSDVLCEIRTRQLQRWRGWCLVDYRGAREPLITSAVDLSGGWVNTFPTGAKIRFAPEGEYSGSFEVTGVVQWNRDRVGKREAEYLRSQTG